MPGPPPLLSRLLAGRIYRLSLKPYQLLDSLLAQLQQIIHLLARERRALGSSLHFDKPSIAGADDVHVNFRARIFVVYQIEQRHTVNDADADGGNFTRARRLLN